MTPTITLGIADDEALFVQGLSAILNQREQLSVALTATDGQDLIDQLNNGADLPDVLLVDLRMKPLNGIETVERLRETYPDVRIAILTTHYREAYVSYMMKLGVSAFLPKNTNPNELVAAIQIIYEKGIHFTESQLLRLHEQMRTGQRVAGPDLEDDPRLTKREVEILTLICQQNTSQEMADKLHVSIRTVHGHRNNLLLKTGAKNTVGLVMYALLNKLVELPERWDGVV